MPYTITVTETRACTATEIMNPGDTGTEKYRQTVEVLDLPKLIAAVNAKPRKPRTPKTK